MLFMPCHVGKKIHNRFVPIRHRTEIYSRSSFCLFGYRYVGVRRNSSFSVSYSGKVAGAWSLYQPEPRWWIRGVDGNVVFALWAKSAGNLRVLAIVLALGFCALVGLSLSRGAILALAFGFGVAMVIPVLSRRQLSRPSLVIITLVSALCVFVIYFERATLIPMLRELSSLKSETGVSKTTPWLGVPELLMYYPFGVGVGGLYAVLPQLNLPLTTSGRIFFIWRIKSCSSSLTGE